MSYTRTLLCLANSRKYPPPGRCIAGREIDADGYGAWIRPVSSRPTQEISEEERRYEDGTDPVLLDIIAVELLTHQPHRHQQENHSIDDGRYWTRVGRASWSEALKAAEQPPGSLWTNGTSSRHGENDQVSEGALDSFDRSLYLIRPESLVIDVVEEFDIYCRGRRRVRAAFTFNDQRYRLAVTDPPVERRYLAGPNGTRQVDESLLCVSLAEPFHGYAYKLVASVITPDRANG